MKIINEKLWDLINSIDYNRPGNRYRFAAYDYYAMRDWRIVLAVYDAASVIDDTYISESELPCVDCLLWSANESESDDYWASFLYLLLQLVDDNTAWVGNAHSIRSRAERGEEACLIYPDDRVYTHTPVSMDTLPKSEWTDALTDWVREIRESEDTVCVYNTIGCINRNVLTNAARIAVKAYERESEIYMGYDDDFDEGSRLTTEIGWMYED